MSLDQTVSSDLRSDMQIIVANIKANNIRLGKNPGAKFLVRLVLFTS